MLLRLSVTAVNTTRVPGGEVKETGSLKNYYTETGFTSHQLKGIEIC